MRLMTIPADSWRRSLDSMSRAYVRAVVSIDVERPDFGKHAEVSEQPFAGITADRSGIVVQVARGNSHLEHTVAEPSAVRFEETVEGALQGIEVDSRDGSRTTVRFRSPVRADLLDPLVE